MPEGECGMWRKMRSFFPADASPTCGLFLDMSCRRLDMKMLWTFSMKYRTTDGLAGPRMSWELDTNPCGRNHEKIVDGVDRLFLSSIRGPARRSVGRPFLKMLPQVYIPHTPVYSLHPPLSRCCLMRNSGCTADTMLLEGMDSLRKTFAPMMLPHPMMVSPPRMVALA